MAEFLSEIAIASNEQATGVEEITGGLEQIDRVTQSNTASAEESAAASEELSSQAQLLKRAINQFKLSEKYIQRKSGTPAISRTGDVTDTATILRVSR